MGAILKGIQSVLIALGIIAVIGTGVILYYNTVKPEEEQTASAEAQAQTESGTEPSESAAETAETETETETADETASAAGGTDDPASSGSGHEHTYTDTVLRPATCTQTGEMKHTCYCGDSYVDAIPVLDHTPGQWITVRSATTTQTGLRQRSCTTCGRVLEEETLPMLAAPVTTSTNTDNSTNNNNNNTNKNSDDDHRHTYTYEISEEATCTTKGKKTYTCSVCGSTFETSIPATNHPSRKTVRTEGNCANPGKIEVICNICNAVISSETLTYDHEWSSWSTTTAATTTTEGVRTRTCKRCGEQQTKSIAKLPSSSGSNSGTNSGSNSGNNGGSNNGSNSGNNSGSNDPSHKHTYTSSVTTQPTCTEAGVTTYRCSCGDTYTEAAPEALGHKASGTWITTKKATTTEDGERVQYCSRCNAVVLSETIAKQEEVHTHVYTITVSRQPTCTQSGTRRHSCACGYYYTSTIPALGHNAGEWEDGTVTGTKVRKCTRCGQVLETKTVTVETPDPDAP